VKRAVILVTDHGGNINDAYYGGCNSGEVFLAREILVKMGVEY
jgi:hypothetical protein